MKLRVFAASVFFGACACIIALQTVSVQSVQAARLVTSPNPITPKPTRPVTAPNPVTPRPTRPVTAPQSIN